MNIAQQERIALREHTCPRCDAEPGKRAATLGGRLT